MAVNRRLVGRSFHRQAGEYDRLTSVQKRVVDRLVELAGHHLPAPPSDVLDVGCGTGRLLALLGRRYPHSRLCGLDLAYNMTCCAADRLGPAATLVSGDAEHLPFRDGSFDLVVSTSTLQWLDDLDQFFRQSRRVLKKDGLLCTAFFGGRTMWELQECYREAAGMKNNCSENYLQRLHRFKGTAVVQETLDRSDFGRVLLLSEIEMDFYPDVPDLLRSVKRIGAGSSAQEGGHAGGLGWRSILNETSRLYRERYGTGGMIPVTYEVLYIIATTRAAV